MKVWFITGASRGFGRQWASAALARGDVVGATARNVADLAPLKEQYGDQVLAIRLDVTDRAGVTSAVDRVVQHFGRIDVAVNNAGYGQFGMVEEVSEQEARDQMETNFFGALWVTQAVIAQMRAQGSGRLLQVSSIGGVTAFAQLGIYHASKWALEGFSQSLASEVAQFGIRVTIIEPAGYATDWRGASARTSATMPEYDALRGELAAARAAAPLGPGDPSATAAAVLTIADAEDPPLRFFLGRGPLEAVTADYERRLAEWRAWADVSAAAHSTSDAAHAATAQEADHV